MESSMQLTLLEIQKSLLLLLAQNTYACKQGDQRDHCWFLRGPSEVQLYWHLWGLFGKWKLSQHEKFGLLMKESPVQALGWSDSGVTCVFASCCPLSEFQWSFLFSLCRERKAARVCSAPLRPFILLCWWFSFLNLWSAWSTKRFYWCVKKGEERNDLHKRKFLQVKLHMWDASVNSMPLFQWPLKARQVKAHVAFESCQWWQKDRPLIQHSQQTVSQ